jgi:DNA-binding transcriptional ArsR family regulator
VTGSDVAITDASKDIELVEKCFVISDLRCSEDRYNDLTKEPRAAAGSTALLRSLFQRKSASRDRFLKVLASHSGWITATKLEKESGLSERAVSNQAYRLRRAGVVESKDGKHRLLRERKPRRMTPCSQKSIPAFEDGRELRQLSRTMLARRGWPRKLIDQLFPTDGKDYEMRECRPRNGRTVTGRFYKTARVKLAESDPSFEEERSRILQPPKKEIEGAILKAVRGSGGRPLTTHTLSVRTDYDAAAVSLAARRLVSAGALVRHTVDRRRAGYAAVDEDELPVTSMSGRTAA